MKIPKWQHKLAGYYKRGKLVCYLILSLFLFLFLNNAAKTCLYGLKISKNIEIGHAFQSRVFFHLTSKLHTSCLSAFKDEINWRPFLEEDRWKHIYNKNVRYLKGSRNLVKGNQCQKLIKTYVFVFLFVLWWYKLRLRLIEQKPLRFWFPLFLIQWQRYKICSL